MHRIWFHLTISIGFAALILGGLLTVSPGPAVQAQAVATDTPSAYGSNPYITNIFEGEPAINVRTGPSTIVYPDVCGSIPLGGTAEALGVSPAHEWVEIRYPGCPNDIGWVYAFNVQVTGAVHVVELPPTPVEPTATIDPTFAAAFAALPTATRLPTFTPPPPLTVPDFSGTGAWSGGFPMGVLIGGLAMLGVAVLGVSFFIRR